MSQHFPNFTSVAPRAAAAPIQTVRVSYTITTNDFNNGYANLVPVAFDIAFADANYSVNLTLELPTANDVPGAYELGHINQKTASGFNATLVLNKSLLGGGGDKIILHVVALHD